MSYFDDVYLKRMTRDGRSIQERIKTRKEKEFDKLFLQKTKYQAYIYKIDDEFASIMCSLQPNKWNEEKMISNLMVSTKEEKFKTGDILSIYEKVKDEEHDNLWLVTYIDTDITRGYQAYQLIRLDSFINHTDEYGDTLHIVPIKFVSETSVFVQDKFSSYGSVSYREPKNQRKFLTKNYDFLTKGLYFDYKSRGWEIVGKDDISIDGIAYVSVCERLQKEAEPKTSEDILVGENENFFLNNR